MIENNSCEKPKHGPGEMPAWSDDMKRRRPGRPTLREGSAKVGMFAMRMSNEDRAAINEAAEKAGKPVTQWAREALMGASRAGHPGVKGHGP